MSEPVDETPEAKAARIEAANKFHSYMRGFRDGRDIRPPRPEFKGHRLESIYEEGRMAGKFARAAATQVAAEWAMQQYGHKPSILRSEDKPS